MYQCYIVTLYTAYTASQLRLGVGSPLRVHAWRGRKMKEQKSVLGLSTIRRNRGVSLEQIAESTKISIRSLEAIEQGDFRKLPGGIYNTSYIRQYARAIEYDESALLAFYTREMARSDRYDARPNHVKILALAGIQPLQHEGIELFRRSLETDLFQFGTPQQVVKHLLR